MLVASFAKRQSNSEWLSPRNITTLSFKAPRQLFQASILPGFMGGSSKGYKGLTMLLEPTQTWHEHLDYLA